MLKSLKIFLLIIILSTFICSFSFATSEEDTSISEESYDTTSSDAPTMNYSGITSVTQVSDYSEANLELNNILNIILIAIGVLIILFAIAILIRLKQ